MYRVGISFYTTEELETEIAQRKEKEEKSQAMQRVFDQVVDKMDEDLKFLSHIEKEESSNGETNFIFTFDKEGM